jgi:hypothetical protein
MRAHPVDVRAPHLTGERAPRRRARPLLAGVRAPLDVHAPTWQACAPYARAPLLAGVRALYTWVRAPLRRARPPPRRRARPTPADVHALPHRRRARPTPQTCAPPSSLACAPYPTGVCAPQQP